ncbi:Cys-tRNA(Pro) deacylase [Arthrobacter sp. TMP15]|uniref:Cys-tRNA(Pro) deacylase n=1 Tax=Arthrobacter sp. TMP15 TaxID=3140789 RepID=UPI0031BA05D6
MAKKTSSTSAGTLATVALKAAGVPFTAHSYTHDPENTNFGLEAATLMGVAPERVFKTLMAEVGDSLVVAVVPVNGSLDLKALAQALGHKKAAMADPATAQRRSGYVLGGISPLGQRHHSPTIVDESALQYATIYVSGGRRGFDVELSPTCLITLTQAITAKIGHPV